MTDRSEERSPGEAGTAEGEARLVRSMLRRLLRVSEPEEAVAELIGLVHDLGGVTLPADEQDDRALPVDLTLGFLPDPVLPGAEPGSAARAALERHLPELVEDVRAVVTRLEQTSRTARDATIDPLTGLRNRRGVTPALQRAAPGDVVAIIDLDRFKDLNDTHGHAAGDDVLRAFGRTLDDGLRESDSCGRYGGEEFLLVLPATALSTAVGVIERIAERWCEQRPLPVTFSAGLAEVDDRGATQAFRAADEALYAAKAAGRDCIRASGRHGSAMIRP